MYILCTIKLTMNLKNLNTTAKFSYQQMEGYSIFVKMPQIYY